jgi:hypothetical protein
MKLFSKQPILLGMLSAVNKLPRTLASRAFLIILLLILANLIWGVFIFYHYVVLVQVRDPEVVKENIAFKYALYDRILQEQKLQDKNFQDFQSKTYSNPFVAGQ